MEIEKFITELDDKVKSVIEHIETEITDEDVLEKVKAELQKVTKTVLKHADGQGYLDKLKADAETLEDKVESIGDEVIEFTDNVFAKVKSGILKIFKGSESE